VDVHCHTFCAADLPIVGFVAHYIPGLTDLSRELTRWPELIVRAILRVVATLPDAVAPAGDAELASLRAALATPAPAPIGPVPAIPGPLLDDLLERLLRLLPFSVGADTRQVLDRYVDTLYLVAHPRAALAATLARTYPSVTMFVPSLVDYDAWSEDRAPTPLATQIQVMELVSKLSLRGRIGRPDARIHPFVAFDPRREAESATAMQMVRHAVESAGFLGVKLYPPVGFAPLDNQRLRSNRPQSARIDAALSALYTYCQAEEVPITAHASPANEFGLGLRTLVAPARWRPALAAFPGLRLNLAHFGHEYGVDPRLGVRTPEAWMWQAATLIDAYPNVYADLSGSPLGYDPAGATRLLGYLLEVMAAFPRVKKRLMYGSDWWLARLDPGTAAGTLETTRGTLAARLAPDEVADVMGRNALRFLGLLDDDNRPRAGRAARRLRRLYAAAGPGAAAPPPWLA
jgi:predicted TIM-barrel fold metal-dependent hydrolase